MRSLVLFTLVAFAPVVLAAQDVPPRPAAPGDTARRAPAPPVDSTRRAQGPDTTRRTTIRAATDTIQAIPDSAFARAHPDTGAQAARDSAAAAERRRKAADTLRTPLARPYMPRSTEVGAYGKNGWHWDRDAIFASGALTLGELLSVVPGVTMLTTGFIAAPQVLAWYGDPGRVRIFIDGIELDPVNVRNGGISDFGVPPMWALEDVTVERPAGELRVHVRTWRVDRTIPQTRVDVLTGSENLNLYRGYFGKRLGNGGAIQLAGQQFSTLSTGGNDGDVLSGMARVGWAKASWSFDGTVLSSSINRNLGNKLLTVPPVAASLPPFQGSEGVAYLRAAWRDPATDGPWAQFIAATIKGGENTSSSSTPGVTTTPTTTPMDSVDTLRSRSQYVLTAGMTRWGVRLSGTARLRSVSGKSYISPGARAEYGSGPLTFSALAERGVDSTIRTDVSARLAPFSWFNVGGSVSRIQPSAYVGPAELSTRLEGAIQWRDRWLSGGLITRSASVLTPPIEIDTALRAVGIPAATGIVVSLRGPLFAGWGLDVDGTEWSTAAPYRPQTQVRTRLYFESWFLGRFPRRNFHLSVSGTVDYRATTFVPLGTDPYGQSTPASTVFGSIVEIRIASAVITWQYRNALANIYATYPGYVMPRLANFYGVRWDFWN